MIQYKKIPEDIHERINALVDFLMEEKNIIFAYLFGGLARERISPLSDVDIAVYVKSITKLDYLGLFSRVTDILGTDEVDLVVLNRSPESLTGRIIRHRKVLVDKEPFVRHRFESVELRKYFDFSIKEKAILQRRYKIG
jgi:uncharacterized protein